MESRPESRELISCLWSRIQSKFRFVSWAVKCQYVAIRKTFREKKMFFIATEINSILYIYTTHQQICNNREAFIVVLPKPLIMLIEIIRQISLARHHWEFLKDQTDQINWRNKTRDSQDS